MDKTAHRAQKGVGDTGMGSEVVGMATGTVRDLLIWVSAQFGTLDAFGRVASVFVALMGASCALRWLAAERVGWRRGVRFDEHVVPMWIVGAGLLAAAVAQDLAPTLSPVALSIAALVFLGHAGWKIREGLRVGDWPHWTAFCSLTSRLLALAAGAVLGIALAGLLSWALALMVVGVGLKIMSGAMARLGDTGKGERRHYHRFDTSGSCTYCGTFVHGDESHCSNCQTACDR